MNVTVTKEQPVLRPLGVLVTLIKRDFELLEQARADAAKVEQPLYIAIGEKLLEAKGQMAHGEFVPWVRKNFKTGIRSAQQHMALARATLSLEKRNAIRISENVSFREAVREHTSNRNFGKPASWRPDVASNIKKAKEEANRLIDEQLSKAQERLAEQALALRLIDIGFKVLAKELHPDRGGSKDAMVRLGKVRARLKAHA